MAEATLQGGTSVATSAKPRRFTVDLFATSINDIEIGIMKQTQHRAKSQQFTKDMDVIGQIKTDGERTGIVAYRAGLWNKKKGPNRRLVIKLFSETMNWRATMEMMIGRSLQLTHGANGMPAPSYAVNIGRSESMIQIERSADKWAFFPERFSFFILGDERARFYKLRQNIFSIGADYNLYDEQDRKIGLLDGKLVSFGGAWNVSISPEHTDPRLDVALQLFCSMLRFNKPARRHIKDLADEMRAGRFQPTLDHYERDLYLNPRRAR
ncbi:MAG: hypothetical protein MRY74_00710 [Neomegalonema sp.]|nr:hypothetical protein [Neomegalonema sp.]